MQFRKIIALAKLTGQGTPERHGSSGAVTVGDQSQAACAADTVIVSRRIQLCGTTESAILDIADFDLTPGDPYSPPSAQQISTTVVGTITAAGNVKVTMGALFGGTVYFVPVALSDSASAVAGKIRTFLSTRLGTGFAVGGSGAAVNVTRVMLTVYGYTNTSTMSMTITNDTATGLTLAASSNISTGSLASGTLINTAMAEDAEGISINVPPVILAYMLRVVEGSVTCASTAGEMIDGSFQAETTGVESEGGGVLVWQPVTSGTGDWTITSTGGYSEVVLTFVLVPD
jgi:hypothetical protein